MGTKLTIDELKILINIIGQVNLPLKQAPELINISDKLKAMIKEEIDKLTKGEPK